MDFTLAEFEEVLDKRFSAFGQIVDKKFADFGQVIDQKMDTRFIAFSREMDKKMDARFMVFGSEMDKKFEKQGQELKEFAIEQTETLTAHIAETIAIPLQEHINSCQKVRI